MSVSLTRRVVARHIQAVFVSDKLWREQKSKLKKVLSTPLYEKRPHTLNRYLVDKLLPVYKGAVKEIVGLGLPVDIETSLEWRLETVTAMIQKLADAGDHFQQQYEAAKRWGTTRTAEEVVAYAVASEVEDFYSSVVSTVSAGLKYTWGTDQRLIDSLAKRLVKKATPEEQEALVKTDQDDFSSRYLDLKYGFFERVKLKTLARKLVSREKITYNFAAWVDKLREMIIANYSEGARDYEFRQFDLHGMKIVVDDRAVSDDEIKGYIAYLKETYARLKAKGLTKVWYGTVFIRCKGCGGVNMNDGGGVGGNYPIAKDIVNIFSRPSPFIVELMTHELGHRYWFKQMTETQRTRFQALVRTHKSPRPDAFFSPEYLSEYRRRWEKWISDEKEHLQRWRTAAFEGSLGARQASEWVNDLEDRGNNMSFRMVDLLKRNPTEWDAPAAVVALRKHALDAAKKLGEYYGTARALLKTRIDGDDAFLTARKTWTDRAQELLGLVEANLLDWGVEGPTEWSSAREQEFAESQGVDPVSTYGASNIDEAWAEAFAHYVLEMDMTQDQVESFRSVLKTGAIENVVRRASAVTFQEGFFKRHPKLKRFAPDRVLDKSGGNGDHPEARQAGNDVWLFPKFWNLDQKIQDFVFTHELGHLALSKYGLAKMMTHLESLGIDPWDAGNLPFGQNNVDEALADCFASYFFDKDVERRYPLWAKALQEVV